MKLKNNLEPLLFVGGSAILGYLLSRSINKNQISQLPVSNDGAVIADVNSRLQIPRATRANVFGRQSQNNNSQSQSSTCFDIPVAPLGCIPSASANRMHLSFFKTNAGLIYPMNTGENSTAFGNNDSVLWGLGPDSTLNKNFIAGDTEAFNNLKNKYNSPVNVNPTLLQSAGNLWGVFKRLYTGYVTGYGPNNTITIVIYGFVLWENRLWRVTNVTTENLRYL